VPAIATDGGYECYFYPAEIEVPSFGLRMKCSKCGGRRVDVRPNWKEHDEPIDWRGRAAWEK
jgi:hypothetical protein